MFPNMMSLSTSTMIYNNAITNNIKNNNNKAIENKKNVLKLSNNLLFKSGRGFKNENKIGLLINAEEKSRANINDNDNNNNLVKNDDSTDGSSPNAFKFVNFFINIILQDLKMEMLRKSFRNMVSLARLSLVLTTISIVIHLLPLTEAAEPLGNPYEILGVSRHATIQDIRKAYKHLVKEWHPDKSDHPAAENKFVEIIKAYEVRKAER